MGLITIRYGQVRPSLSTSSRGAMNQMLASPRVVSIMLLLLVLLVHSNRSLSAVIDLIAVVTAIVVDLREKGHRMDGTGRPVETPTEGPHKSATVLVAEGAVEHKITSSIDGNETVENVAQGSKNGFFVRLRLRSVEDFVYERRCSWQLAHQEHDDDSDEGHRDADLVGSGPLLPVAPDNCLTLSHDLAKFLALANRMDEERIKDDEQRQWQQHLIH